MDVIRITNIDQYTQEIVEGTLVLTPRVISVTDDNLREFPIAKSHIISCKIQGKDGVISEKTKYQGILTDVWTTLPTQKILQNTGFNFKLEDLKGDKGYKWCKSLHMSFQGKDAYHTFQELVSFCRLLRYEMDLLIRLQDHRLIHYTQKHLPKSSPSPPAPSQRDWPRPSE